MSSTIEIPKLKLEVDDLALAERLALLSDREKREVMEALDDDQLEALRWDWTFWGRPDQQQPTDPNWRILFFTSGRGAGKTAAGAQIARELARARPNEIGAFIAPTPRDARDYMIEGKSGILAISPPSERPIYEPSLLKLTWPNGATALIRTAAEPEAIRGPNFGWAWCDELAKWRFLDAAWDNLRFSLRDGSDPKTVITTTPRPLKLIRELNAGRYAGEPVHVRRVSTLRNAANLAGPFLAELIHRYYGTRLGRQEIFGEVIEDIEGAVWRTATIEATRVTRAPAREQLRRIAVGVDPSGGANAIGIVVDAIDWSEPCHGYTLADRTNPERTSPDEWARDAIAAYHDFGADAIVAEVNYGGQMVLDVIRTRDPNVVVELVHASRGKKKRAEPVEALYEQRRWHHVGRFPELEDEQTTWVEGETNWSPNRMDAHVWAATWLAIVEGEPSEELVEYAERVDISPV